ncbi:MAG: M4 family metallopeptidase [Patescibacteria group bacterium]
MKKIITFFLTLTISVIYLVGVFHNAYAESNQTEDSNIAQLQNEDGKETLTDLQNKLGDNLQYTIDQNTGNLSFIKSQGNGIPLTGASSNAVGGTSMAGLFLKEYGALFGINDPVSDLSVMKETTDALGMKHIRYNQRYAGVPVFGGEVIVHLNGNLTVASANGRAISNTSLDVTPVISSEVAVTKAKEIWQNQFDTDNPEVLKTNLYVFNKSLFNKNNEDQNYLVWQIELYKKTPSLHEFYFIDTRDGSLVHQITGIKNAISRRIYDCSYGDGFCYLDAYDAVSAYTLGRSEGKPIRGTNPWYGLTDVDNLYSITGYAHNYFLNTFSLNGANNLGGLGDGTYVPYTRTEGLAYIDPVYPACPNAFYDGYAINFCTGWVTTDIVAHEYGHGVTQFSVVDGYGNPAGLIYSDESGALSESYADVFGEAVENYSDGSGDWLIGEDLTGGALRSMSDPMSMSYPDRFNSPYFYCGDSDQGGVHINNSVPNYAAYLMAMGGTFNNCTINGIGRAKEEAIYYRALTQYLTTSSGFNDAYNALVTSCQDLYGALSSDCRQVVKALRAVEMNQGGYCSGQTAVDPGCAVIDATPSVTQVSSDKADGTYIAGTVIDIDVTFSKAVTSSGEITVTLETGATDRSCTFSVSNAAFGSCDYTIQAGDNSNDLNVKSISGSITDAYGNTVTDLTPGSDLSSNKNIKIGAPTLGLLLSQASDTEPFIKRVGHHGNKIKSFAVHKGKGGVLSVEADINGDGINEIVVAPEAGLGGKVKAYTKNGAALASFSPFGSKFNDGISLTSGDVNNDGKKEIIVSPLTKGTPKIKVFRYANKKFTLLKEIKVFGSSVPGGLIVSSGDVNDDNIDEIIVSPYQDQDKKDRVVKIYAYRNNKLVKLASKQLYSKRTEYQGIKTTTADLDGDGRDEIIATPSLNFGDDIQVYGYANGGLTHLDDVWAYSASFNGLTSLATGDINSDGRNEIMLTIKTGGLPYVFIYKFNNGKLVLHDKFRAYDKEFTGGVNLAVLDIDGDNKAEVITAPYSGKQKVKVWDVESTKQKLHSSFWGFGKDFEGGINFAR